MAWRIDESVIRGEIDNRMRGRVTGRIWFAGRAAPVELDLTGNAWRDLAGRRLEFVNPEPQPGDLDSLAARQTGVIGDCTASRKVKVPDIPMHQIGKYYAAKKKWTWHWGDCPYLEWFSATNGRVVIESASYQLTIAPDIAWDMTPAEEETQRKENAAALENLMRQLSEATASPETETEAAADHDAPWTEKPQTEAEAEKMQADRDRLADRVNARLQREGSDADYEKILEEELERRQRERGEKPLTPEEEAKHAEWIDEANRAAAEALANPDPELEAERQKKPQLAERASDLSLRLRRDTEKNSWEPPDASEEHPVVELISNTMSAGAKLAGALNGETWPPPLDFSAGIIVRLKRARGYFEDALLAAEACAEEKLTEPAWLAGVTTELKAMTEECDRLIAELRARLERGFD